MKGEFFLTDEINGKEVKTNRPYRKHYSRKPYTKKTEDKKDSTN